VIAAVSRIRPRAGLARTLGLATLACVAAGSFGAPRAAAQGAAGQGAIDPDQPALVVTSGEGVVQAVPDRAWVTIAAESRAPNAAEAQRRNAVAMRPVHERLREAGVPDEAIRTVSYDLQQEWDYVDGRRVSRGYVARNAIEVRVEPLDRVGEVLELAVSGGATTVSGLRFDVKERAALEREALRLAVADARARADAAAAGAGQTVLRVLRIDEQGFAVPPPRPMMRELAQAVQADAPPIAAGEMEIRAQVTVTSVLR
jgi:uncharacterized protein